MIWWMDEWMMYTMSGRVGYQGWKAFLCMFPQNREATMSACVRSGEDLCETAYRSPRRFWRFFVFYQMEILRRNKHKRQELWQAHSKEKRHKFLHLQALVIAWAEQRLRLSQVLPADIWSKMSKEDERERQRETEQQFLVWVTHAEVWAYTKG